jgi:hypothetical protein
MSDRYFDRREAEELLPMIAGVLNEARDDKQKMDGLDHDLAQAAAKIMVMGGWIPPHRELAEKRQSRDQLREKIKEAIERIQEIGCVLKDLDEGLVDFPALLDGHEVFLCWKLGEERIGYWHGLDEGFAGRKPLDEDEESDTGTSGGPRRLH